MANKVGNKPMDEPLAYFLTWTTYGSWLPGDKRGWVEKPGRFRTPDAKREAAARERMTESELTLTAEQCDIVEKTIADHCRIRGWHLHAVTCRTQHVHVVVSAPNRDPEEVMEQFKAWCTRRLKEHMATTTPSLARPALVEEKPDAPALEHPPSKPDAPAKEKASAKPDAPAKVRTKWWTQRGSKRRLYDQPSLEAAIRYVVEGQDGSRSESR